MNATATTHVVSHTNRKGHVYYLHAGKTKTGKTRYFVTKSISTGALSELPAGFEIVESINAVVSVRRIDPSAHKVPEADLACVRAELAKHPRLRRYRVDVLKGEIIVFEPVGGLSAELARSMEVSFQMAPSQLERHRSELDKHTRYSPVLRFAPLEGQYVVSRMNDRGGPRVLDRGPLESLVPKHLDTLGTPASFELY